VYISVKTLSLNPWFNYIISHFVYHYTVPLLFTFYVTAVSMFYVGLISHFVYNTIALLLLFVTVVIIIY